MPKDEAKRLLKIDDDLKASGEFPGTGAASGSASAGSAAGSAHVTDSTAVPAATASKGTYTVIDPSGKQSTVTVKSAKSLRGGSRRRRKSRGGSRKKRSKRKRLSSKKKRFSYKRRKSRK